MLLGDEQILYYNDYETILTNYIWSVLKVPLLFRVWGRPMRDEIIL